jgi:hypothetical protein
VALWSRRFGGRSLRRAVQLPLRRLRRGGAAKRAVSNVASTANLISNLNTAASWSLRRANPAGLPNSDGVIDLHLNISFGGMRAARVPTVLVYCSDHRFTHWTRLAVDQWAPDEVSRPPTFHPHGLCGGPAVRVDVGVLELGKKPDRIIFVPKRATVLTVLPTTQGCPDPPPTP